LVLWLEVLTRHKTTRQRSTSTAALLQNPGIVETFVASGRLVLMLVRFLPIAKSVRGFMLACAPSRVSLRVIITMMFKALVASAGNEYPPQPSEAHLFVL
jgi:hypothetical protein